MNATDVVTIPEPLSRLIGRLPQWPPSLLLATALNVGLASRLDQEALARLRDKVIRIEVRDAGVSFTLCFDGRAFRQRSISERADVTIAATVQDFALLALRKADPDTLFFSRRLTMEGDTEVGLIVKNMLDAVDLAPLTARLEGPAARFLGARLRSLLARYVRAQR